MAMKPWSAEEIAAVAADLEYVAQKLSAVADEMRRKRLPSLVLQADAAFGVYRSTLVKLGADAETEFRDQHRCTVTGDTPRWRKNQITIATRKALKESQANVEQQGLVKQPAKKRGK